MYVLLYIVLYTSKSSWFEHIFWWRIHVWFCIMEMSKKISFSLMNVFSVLHTKLWPIMYVCNYQFLLLGSFEHIYLLHYLLQLYIQHYDLSALISFVLDVSISTHDRWNIEFNVESKWQIFEKLFTAMFYLLSDFLPENWMKESFQRKYFFFSYFVLFEMFGPGFELQSFT